MLESTLQKIHASPHMLVMNFAGAGVNALSWLHSIGGSSRTILEACDRYVPKSLIETVGFEPKRFTSKRVSLALASAAYKRAKYLAEKDTPVFGVGATATIATDRKKRGKHRCQITVKDVFGTSHYGLTLKKGARNRYEEERMVSQIIIKAVIETCGVYAYDNIVLINGERLEHSFIANPKLREWQTETNKLLIIKKNGKLEIADKKENIVVLSGSFNPLHNGHKKLKELVEKQTNAEVYFELALQNVDKNAIDLKEARKRAMQFLGYAPLILSKSPLFSEKAKLFPNSKFIVGADTAKRLVEAKYYNNDKNLLNSALQELDRLGSSFLVAGRSHKEKFQTLDDIDIAKEFRNLFIEIPEEQFHEDISSTQIRSQLMYSPKLKDNF